MRYCGSNVEHTASKFLTCFVCGKSNFQVCLLFNNEQTTPESIVKVTMSVYVLIAFTQAVQGLYRLSSMLDASSELMISLLHKSYMQLFVNLCTEFRINIPNSTIGFEWLFCKDFCENSST